MSHYFGSPTGAYVMREVAAELAGERRTVRTASGVFSADGLDHATAILLRTVPAPTRGTVVDLGCGWGPIALHLALSEPGVEVIAVDVNPRARELCAINAELLGVADRVRVLAPEQAPKRYDELWSNPPIRIGKPALHALLLEWLPRVELAHLVVGKNLGADSLARWLAEQGWPCERLASSKGFRVLEARNPVTL